MARKNNVSKEVVAEAAQIAKSTQRPGQTKEQTKLIEQGIQKGIAEYKKRQKEKSRAFNKQKRKLDQQLEAQRNLPEESASELVEEAVVYRHHPLAWVLLVVSWLGFAAYLVLMNQG